RAPSLGRRLRGRRDAAPAPGAPLPEARARARPPPAARPRLRRPPGLECPPRARRAPARRPDARLRRAAGLGVAPAPRALSRRARLAAHRALPVRAARLGGRPRGGRLS